MVLPIKTLSSGASCHYFPFPKHWANRRRDPGRPRPRRRGTRIRAGRGGGDGSSSVSSVRGTCRAGGRPAEKTNRGFFFLLLLLLPHRNTHKHPAGARATGGASPPARAPILLAAGASLPAAWWCRVSRYRRREGGEGGGEGALCVSLSRSVSPSQNKMPTGSAAAGMTPSTGAKHSQPPPLPHSTSATAAAAAATGARVLGRAAPFRSAPRSPGRAGGEAEALPRALLRLRAAVDAASSCGARAEASWRRRGRAGRLARVWIFPEAERSGVRPRWRSCAWGALRPGSQAALAAPAAGRHGL